MIDEETIKQIKLSSGDEIVCEIVEWEEDELLVKNALQIVRATTVEEQAIYIFNQWMTYCTDLQQQILVNPHNVIAAYTPARIMEIQYVEALETLGEYAKDLEESFKQYEIDRKEDSLCSSDSSSNIVNLFDGKDTLH